MEENQINIINDPEPFVPAETDISAGFIRRTAAFIIDSIILFLMLLFLLLNFFDYFNILKLLNSWAFSSFVYIIFFIYQTALMISEFFWDGKTPGKFMLDIAVRNNDGSRPEFLRLLIRNLGRCTYFIPPLFIIPDLVCWIVSGGKRIGDLISGTRVVKLK